MANPTLDRAARGRRFGRAAVLLLGPAALAACSVPLAGVTSVGNPYGIPTSVALPLPPTLSQTSPLSQASPLNQVSAYRTATRHTASVPVSIVHDLHDALNVYTSTTLTIGQLLTVAAGNGLPVGKALTFPDSSHPGEQLTARLDVLGDHALLALYRGAVATQSAEVLAVRYTSPSHGTAWFRTLTPDPQLGRLAVTTSFDLKALVATADLAIDATAVATASIPAAKVRASYAFAANVPTPAGSPSFSVVQRATVNVPGLDASVGLAANFLPDGSAAAIKGVTSYSYLGTRLAPPYPFVWQPNDGNATWTLTSPHDYYVGANGLDVATDSAPLGLRAVLPPDSTFYPVTSPWPTDPASADVFADPVFAFPTR